VIGDVFAIVESLVKNQCRCNNLKHFHSFFASFYSFFFPTYVSPWFLCGLSQVAKKLMRKLEIKFSAHGVMNDFGIVYSQYWLQLDFDASFANHP
jgi:hypothetical protein